MNAIIKILFQNYNAIAAVLPGSGITVQKKLFHGRIICLNEEFTQNWEWFDQRVGWLRFVAGYGGWCCSHVAVLREGARGIGEMNWWITLAGHQEH
ncbi:MAG: hypothetical protein GY761_08015 [Hyphomicrobiales bacterium]|nr:hypothetical protein [Hyphomicrobiales bacterium]